MLTNSLHNNWNLPRSACLAWADCAGTRIFPASSAIPDSLILGAELFYLPDAYYRRLMSDVLVIARSMNADEVQKLAIPKPAPLRKGTP